MTTGSAIGTIPAQKLRYTIKREIRSEKGGDSQKRAVYRWEDWTYTRSRAVDIEAYSELGVEIVANIEGGISGLEDSRHNCGVRKLWLAKLG